jgi:hypothetical protein
VPQPQGASDAASNPTRTAVQNRPNSSPSSVTMVRIIKSNPEELNLNTKRMFKRHFGPLRDFSNPLACLFLQRLRKSWVFFSGRRKFMMGRGCQAKHFGPLRDSLSLLACLFLRHLRERLVFFRGDANL